MSKDQNPHPLLQQQSLKLWRDFCRDLEKTGCDILSSELAEDVLDHAEGLRYVTRLLRNGLEFQIENQEKSQPFFNSYAHETMKMGADNPDIRYFNCLIDPSLNYVIRGTRGSVQQLLLGSYGGSYGETGQLILHDSWHHLVDSDDKKSSDVYITVGQQKNSGNHLFLNSNSHMLIVRQMFLDRDKEQLANIQIHIDDSHNNISNSQLADQHILLNLNKMQDGFKRCCQSMLGTANTFSHWVEGLKDKVNTLPAADQNYCQQLGGDPNIYYYHGYWRLEKHQAMIIYVPRLPICKNWNLQINNIWMESLDYRYFNIHLNKHTAHYEKNGAVIMILTHAQQTMFNIENQLNTTGHERGSFSFRWVNSDELVDPQVQVVDIDNLEQSIENLKNK